MSVELKSYVSTGNVAVNANNSTTSNANRPTNKSEKLPPVDSGYAWVIVVGTILFALFTLCVLDSDFPIETSEASSYRVRLLWCLEWTI